MSWETGFSGGAGRLGDRCGTCIDSVWKTWAVLGSQRSRHTAVPIIQVSQWSSLFNQDLNPRKKKITQSIGEHSKFGKLGVVNIVVITNLNRSFRSMV